MKQLMRRSLSIALMLMLVVSMGSFSFAAEGDTTTDTPQETVLNEGGTNTDTPTGEGQGSEGQSDVQDNEGEQGSTEGSGDTEGGSEGGSDQTEPEGWTAADFTFDGTVVTGLSESGIAKRAGTTELVIPAETPDGEAVTELGAAGTGAGGLFATADEKFEKVTLPATITKIGNNAFREAGLKEINFPEGLTEIGTSAFMMNSLVNIDLPDTMTTLGAGAFTSNFTLANVHIPENEAFTTIPASAFARSDKGNMENFKELTIPSNITSIGDRAFAGTALTEIEIPGSVTSIGQYAFSQPPATAALEKIVLNEGLETVKQYAFDNCKAQTVVLPTTVTTLHKNAFRAQTEREKVTLLTTLALADLPAGVAQTSDHHVIISAAEWTAADFTFEGTVVTGLSETGIAKRPLNKELVIPAETPDGEAVTELGAAGTAAGGLFATADEKFEKVTLPATITKIGNNAFREAGLKEINFPDGLTEIGNTAFQMNSLVNVDLPDTLTSLGNGAFTSNQTLASVHIPENEAFTAIPASAFAWSNQGCMENFTELTIPSNITSIGSRAFAGAAFTSLEIPASVTTIAANAFAQPPASGSLEKLVLNEGLVSVAQYAFDNCKAMSVVLPTTVTTLHKNAFRAQTARDKVTVVTELALADLPAGVAQTSDYHVIETVEQFAEEVAEQIEALPSQVTAEDKAAVQAARAAYDNLVKANGADLISEADVAKLEASEARIDNIEAQEAQKAAEEAQQKAEEAQAAAEEAQKKAEEAQKAAEEAQKAAAEDKIAAEEAQKLAEEAQKASEEAQKLAEEAQKASEEAQKLAEEAQKASEASEKASAENKAAAEAALAKAVTAQAAAEAAKAETQQMLLEAKYTPDKVKIKKVVRGKKRAKISWKRVKKNTKGYEIRIINKKTGEVVKTVKVKQAKKNTIKKTVKKLKKGKYKVQVRAYNEAVGQTFYGKWSKAKTVKIKK